MVVVFDPIVIVCFVTNHHAAEYPPGGVILRNFSSEGSGVDFGTACPESTSAARQILRRLRMMPFTRKGAIFAFVEFPL